MLFNSPLPQPSALRLAIRQLHHADENRVIDALMSRAEMDARAVLRAWERARRLVVNIRADQGGKGGVDALLHEFSLSSEEGVVLMCLAEALLRVPDRLTQDKLIRDKLADGDWSSHLGNSDSIFVNASSWGLLMTGKMVTYNKFDREHQFGVLKRSVGRLGEPVIRSAMRGAMQIMGAQFVMGKDIEAALKRARTQESQGYRYSYDMLGEGARCEEDAQNYLHSYENAIERLGKAATVTGPEGPERNPGISVKLSAIHPKYHFSHRERVMDEVVPRLLKLALAAKAANIGLTVDAEEAERLDISLDVIEAVFSDPALEGWHGFGLAVQSYQKRALAVLEWCQDLSARVGRKLMIRLVKGAYWDSEIKWSQSEGDEDYPVFTRKASSDLSFQACARYMLQQREYIYSQFASHNAYSVACILELDDEAALEAEAANKTCVKRRQGYEFQRLHGMGESLFAQIIDSEGVPCRIYAPVGKHADLLAYLVRRLLENGANSSFVNNIVDESIPVESLLQDPVAYLKTLDCKRNTCIALPKDILAPRLNSRGLDLNDCAIVEPLSQRLAAEQDKLLAAPRKPEGIAVRSPAQRQVVIGQHHYAGAEQIEAAMSRAHASLDAWQAHSAKERSALLLRLADSLEEDQQALLSLCMLEAGKTLADGMAELREAVDFCRYYAQQAMTQDVREPLQGRGLVACISPWNFPLAIFLGQISAALVSGNTVIAKPAEQTALIALHVGELFKRDCEELNISADILQIIVAEGLPFGQQVISDERVRAVMFTGSTATGRWLADSLAERSDAPIPLIAETGGQNAMIVDSTALPEQVVDDIISSGFQSAGQRCSALRVLFVQDDVADKLIHMLKGAMNELHIGDPRLLNCDVGPVIDERALARLVDHQSAMSDKAGVKLLHACALPADCAQGLFFAPHLYEVEGLHQLKEEVFGPVVHLIRFKGRELNAVLEQIKGSGFGLTLGVHSRIEGVCQDIARKAEVGNVYINRNMIGAVVGVQPFGGRGLSGTGPKAGGPLYLSRLQQSLNPSPQSEQEPCPTSLEAESVCASVLDAHIADAREAQCAWAALAPEKRSAKLQRLMVNLETRLAKRGSAEHELAFARGLALLEQAADFTRPLHLPGPTGESNILHFEARGVLLMPWDKHNLARLEASLPSLLAVLAAGNALFLAMDDEDFAEDLRFAMDQAELDADLIKIVDLAQLGSLLDKNAMAGLVSIPSHRLNADLNRRLLKGSKALRAFICEDNVGLLLKRMVCEKTLSTDTTAAGGNTSLMTM